MKNLIAVFLGISCLASCSFSNDDLPLTRASTVKIKRLNNLNNKEVPEQFLALHEPAAAEASAVPEANIGGNLYGKFFNERAEFFIIENPKNKLLDTEVKSITLYYLDGQLGKIKYILGEDATKKLIKYYGNFKISAHDQKNREILKSGKVLVKSDDTIALNRELDNYELKWTTDNNVIMYKVNAHDKQEPYRYVEQRSNYENNFKEVEKSWVVN